LDRKFVLSRGYITPRQKAALLGESLRSMTARGRMPIGRFFTIVENRQGAFSFRLPTDVHPSLFSAEILEFGAGLSGPLHKGFRAEKMTCTTLNLLKRLGGKCHSLDRERKGTIRLNTLILQG
jgi:hypothetical protein